MNYCTATILITYNQILNSNDYSNLIITNHNLITPTIKKINDYQYNYIFNKYNSQIKVSFQNMAIKSKILELSLDINIRLDNNGFQLSDLSHLIKLDVHPENFEEVTNGEGIFFNTNFVPDNISSLITNFKNLRYGFKNCTCKCDINLFNLEKLYYLDHCFEKSKFNRISLSNFSSIQSAEFLFLDSETKTIDCSRLQIENLISLRGLFKNCYNLEYLNISEWNTKSITDMSYLFYGVKKLENKLCFKKWETSNVINMTAMFKKSNISSNLIYFNMDSIQLTKNMLSESEYYNCNSILSTNCYLIDSNLWGDNEKLIFELPSSIKKNTWKKLWIDNRLFIELSFNVTVSRSELFSILNFYDNTQQVREFSSVKQINLLFGNQLNIVPSDNWKIYKLDYFEIESIGIDFKNIIQRNIQLTQLKVIDGINLILDPTISISPEII